MDSKRHDSKRTSNTPSSQTSKTTSPETPSNSRRTSDRDEHFLTPASTAGSLSDPRNGALVRRPAWGLTPDRDTLLQQLGKREEKIEQRNEFIRDLELRLEIANDSKEELHGEISHLKQQLHELYVENHRLCAAQQADTATIKDLQAQLLRANQTIKVQSNQIRNPKDGRQYENGGYDGQQQLAIGWGQEDVPRGPKQPSFEMVPYKAGQRQWKRASSAGRHQQSLQYHSNPMRRGNSQFSNPWEDDRKFEPRGEYGQGSHHHPDIHHPMKLEDTFQEDSFFRTVVPQGYPTGSRKSTDLRAALSRYFNKVEGWAKVFTNKPNMPGNPELSYEAQIQFAQITNPDIVIALLASSRTRFLAVTKWILNDIVNFAFYPILIKNFTSEYDARLMAEKSKLYTGVPNHIRQESIIGTAKIVEEMTGDGEWTNHIGLITTNRVRHLFNVLTPLMDPAQAPDDAWKGLYHIVEEGISLGLSMLRKVSVFSTDFPPVGPNSPFNPANMTNSDPELRENPSTLAKMGLKVRLSVTPVVYETSFEELQNMEPQTLVPARVLLMR